MRIAKGTFLLGALLFASTAWAGPSVPKSQMKALPAEVISGFAPAQEELNAMEAALIEAETQAALAKSGIKSEKLDAKATDAQLKADKAELKAAKKDGDKADKQEAKEIIAGTKAEQDAQDAEARAASAMHKYQKAQVDLLKAEIDLKEAQLEHQKAQAVMDNDMEIDVNIFASAASKAEIAFQEARAGVALAEAKVSIKGGDADGDDTAAAPVDGEAPVEEAPPVAEEKE